VQTSSACRNLLLIQQLNKQQILGMRSLSALLPKNIIRRDCHIGVARKISVHIQ